MRYLRGVRNIYEEGKARGGRRKKESARRAESCKSYACDDGPYKSEARLVKLTCRRRRRKRKMRLADIFVGALALCNFQRATTNSRADNSPCNALCVYTPRFHAAPECHGVAERYDEFRFHYNPLKRAWSASTG